MSGMERSLEARARLLSRATIPANVALNDYGPLYFHRQRLLRYYGLDRVVFFERHLNQLELAGRARAFSDVDLADRIAVTDPSPEIRLVQVSRCKE